MHISYFLLFSIDLADKITSTTMPTATKKIRIESNLKLNSFLVRISSAWFGCAFLSYHFCVDGYTALSGYARWVWSQFFYDMHPILSERERERKIWRHTIERTCGVRENEHRRTIIWVENDIQDKSEQWKAHSFSGA